MRKGFGVAAAAILIAIGFGTTQDVSAATKTITVKSKGTQSVSVIQSALDKAKNDKNNKYVINVQKGKYKMSTKVGLHIYSNTTLNMKGVTITRTAKQPGSMITFADPRRESGGGYTLGKYKRAQNVIINGGTLDAGTGKKNAAAVSSLITFSHVQNVKIKNMKFIYRPKQKDSAHSIEFGAANKVLIDKCKFYGNHNVNCALQIESARKGVAHSELMGKADGTKTKNVTISNCYFNKFKNTMGTQHGTSKDRYTNMIIKYNRINSPLKGVAAIYTYNYTGKIYKNTFSKCGKRKVKNGDLIKMYGSKKIKLSKNKVKK